MPGRDLPLCTACGVQYPADHDLACCRICLDERQYVPADGQRWTSRRELVDDGIEVELREEHGLLGIGLRPSFAIGQRALLVPGPGGNLLWDCISHVDDDAVAALSHRGGIAAIAISHPHFYSASCDWSEAFGGVPIFAHAADEQWLARRDHVQLWDGDRIEVLPGRTMIRLGIHFAGGSVLHWAGPDGRGALCTGDIIQVAADTRWVSFMYSYPNFIPERPERVISALAAISDLSYDVVYGAFWGQVLNGDATAAVIRSARRYLQQLGHDLPAELR